MPDVDKYLLQINVADNMYYGACCIDAGLHEVEPDPPAEDNCEPGPSNYGVSC